MATATCCRWRTCGRVPKAVRLSRFAESTVPAQYAGALWPDGTWRAGVDLSQLPEPMRRELAWCVFRIIELGGKIPTPALSMLVRRLGEVLADGAGEAPASLLGLSGRDWCQHIQHAAHRRTGQLPAATTMNNIRRLLARMMRLLVTAMDTGPWWHRDQWNPVEDTRIPLRDHEPIGRYSVRFDADRVPVAAARSAVALQGRPGHRGVELVDGAPPGRGGEGVRRVPARPPG